MRENPYRNGMRRWARASRIAIGMEGFPCAGERTPPFHVARIGFSYPELNNSVLAAGPFLIYLP